MAGIENLALSDGVLNNFSHAKKPIRHWKQMSDEERLQYVWNTYGIYITPKELQGIDMPAYRHLLNRGLTARLDHCDNKPFIQYNRENERVIAARCWQQLIERYGDDLTPIKAFLLDPDKYYSSCIVTLGDKPPQD